jgi:hypothetical protein
MSIARFENITVNRLTFGQSSFGEQSTTVSLWFATRAKVHSVSNNVRISEKYRVYADIVNFTVNYTPNTKEIVNNQNLYSIYWKNFDWRIDSIRETDDRMKVTMTCVRNDPVTAV